MKKINLYIIISLFVCNISFADLASFFDKSCIEGNCTNGHGTYEFTIEETTNLVGQGEKNIYTGEFKNKKPNGLGTYIYSNGDKYVG